MKQKIFLLTFFLIILSFFISAQEYPSYTQVTSARVLGDDENTIYLQITLAGDIPENPKQNVGFVWALDLDKNVDTGDNYNNIGSDYYVKVAYEVGEGWYGAGYFASSGFNKYVELFNISENQVVVTVSKDAINYKNGFRMVAFTADIPGIYPEAQHIKYPGDPYPYMHIFNPVIEKENVVIQNGVTFALCERIDESWCKQENPNAEGNGPFEYQWGDGNVDCSWFPEEHQYGEKGEYTIKVRVKNTCGFISERSSKVNVNSVFWQKIIRFFKNFFR